MGRLILFDIDHTLIDPGNAGVNALDMVFDEKYGISNATAQVAVDGRTDYQIMREMLRRFDLVVEEREVQDIARRYLQNLKLTVDNPRGRILPGVQTALSALGKDPACRIGLLTGNAEAGAQIKLGHFGLQHHFSLGAYGSDHEDRNRLLPIAVQKAQQLYGQEFAYNQCLVIGDTPLDVQCAKPYGAVAVGVATGRYSQAELTAAGADFVVADLRQRPFFD